MSTFSCPIVEYVLQPHPNADTLSIANVLGWTVVVKTQDFVGGNKAVYIPLDTIAEKEHPLLGFLEGKKVKTIKLRKALSQGLLIPLKAAQEYAVSKGLDQEIAVGLDLSPWLDVKKWEPPVNRNLGSCNQVAEPENFNRYTDIENLKNFPEVLPMGTKVWVTEKLHGTSARYGIVDGVELIGSRKRCLVLSPEKPTAWHQVAVTKDVFNKIKELKRILLEELVWVKTSDCNVVVYGEIVGKSVQDLHYNHKEDFGFYVYDIKINDQYLPPAVCHLLAPKVGFSVVPVLFAGDLDQTCFDLRLGKSTLCQDHIREGIVIEPSTPTYNYEVGRVKLKVISEEYLQRSGATDFEG